MKTWNVLCLFNFGGKKFAQKFARKKKKQKNRINKRFSELSTVPTIGLEPTTYALRVHCSTN